MDIFSVINYLPPYALHAALLATVVLSATLVFVFSFRSTGEPPFSERKSSSKKKKQPKEKKNLNGHAVTVNQGEKPIKAEAKKEVQKSPAKNDKTKQNEAQKEKSSDKKPIKEKGKAKEKKTETANSSPKEKGAKSPGKGKENVEGKSKRLLRLALPLKSKEESGGWEQAISRKERRARKALLENPNTNYNADENPLKTPEIKGNKKDKNTVKSNVPKSAPNEGNDLAETDVVDNAVSAVPAKKNAESKQKQVAPVDEPPVGSSTVYDEFAEVFKEPSKKAIKKRVRKE